MNRETQMERFSFAWVSAVVAAAGYAQYRPDADDDSVDLGITATGEELRIRPHVEVQLKCTARLETSADVVTFRLKRKNYDDLRATLFIPRILILVSVPDQIEDWTDFSDSGLLLRQSAWWVCIEGQPEKAGSGPVTIRIPEAQRFTPNALKELMSRLNRGERP